MIYLYDKSGDLVDGGRYDGPFARRKAMNRWQLRYGKRYSECFIQIAPNTNEFLIREDGQNIMRSYKNPRAKQPMRIRKKKSPLALEDNEK